MVLRKPIVRLSPRKHTLLLFFLYCSLLSCHNSKTDYTIGLDGDYFFSENTNLSYYIPTNFKGAFVKNDHEFNSLLNTIYHPKLKQSIDNFYKNIYTLPEATNAQYFYSEDSNKYAFIILNEIKHIRLNDKIIEYFKEYRNSSFYKNTQDSLATIKLTDDEFINKSSYQIMTTRGNTITKNDSLFWEFYIISKYQKTFTILTNSNNEFDFQQYIKAIDYGDKRNSF